MWVYVLSEPRLGLWTVGHYTPNREWHADSDHASQEAAAARVHYLNGGCCCTKDASYKPAGTDL